MNSDAGALFPDALPPQRVLRREADAVVARAEVLLDGAGWG